MNLYLKTYIIGFLESKAINILGGLIVTSNHSINRQMVSFARARTRAWLSILRPESIQPINNEMIELENSKEISQKQAEQNKRFLEVSKNGGMWLC